MSKSQKSRRSIGAILKGVDDVIQALEAKIALLSSMTPLATETAV